MTQVRSSNYTAHSRRTGISVSSLDHIDSISLPFNGQFPVSYFSSMAALLPQSLKHSCIHPEQTTEIHLPCLGGGWGWGWDGDRNAKLTTHILSVTTLRMRAAISPLLHTPSFLCFAARATQYNHSNLPTFCTKSCFIISLLYASTCFEHYCAHHQEVKIVLYRV